MSAAAVRIYDFLVSEGVADSRARNIADVVDAELVENRRAAEAHADQAVAESEKKSAAQFAAKTEVAALEKTAATRVEVAKQGDKTDAGFARIDDRFNRADERFDRVDERFDRVDDKFTKVDENFAKVNDHLARHGERLSALEANQRQTNRILLGIGIPVVVAVVKYIFGF